MFVAEGQPRIGVEIMTDMKSFADEVRGQATGDSPQARRAPERRRWTDVMMRSLPALVVPPTPIPRPGSCPRVVCEEEKMNRKMLFLARAVVYLLAFLVPPVLISVVGMRAVESARYEGAAKCGNGPGWGAPCAPEARPRQADRLWCCSATRAPRSPTSLPPTWCSPSPGAFNVYAAAPEREAVTLSGGLDVLPHLSLAELGQRLGGEDPDVIVVPEMPDIGSTGHRPVAEWLREHAEGSGTVVSVCNGAQVLADAGLLDGRRATANWANIAEWERRYPNTEWVRGLRYVEDGNVISAAGVTSGIGATLHVIRGYVGEEAATALAQKIGYPDQRVEDEPRIPAERLTASDRALYVLWTAYGWGKPSDRGRPHRGNLRDRACFRARRLPRAGLNREHHDAYTRRSSLAREDGARSLLRPTLPPCPRARCSTGCSSPDAPPLR